MNRLRELRQRAWRRISWRLLASYLLVGFAAVATVGSTFTFFIYTYFKTHLEDPRQGDFQRNLLQGTLIAAIVAVVSSIGVSIFVSRRIVDPIERLIDASSRLADGNYEERVEITDDFEIAQLAASFNQMADALEQTEHQRQALIADVAHELRTPLTTIKGYMEALIDGVVPAESETFALIYDEADRMYRLVQDLQELSRLEAGQMVLDPRQLSLVDIVHSVVGRARPQFEAKGVYMTENFAPDSAWIYADSDRLHQVLLNLLGNALQYTPAGGRVRVSTYNEKDRVCVAIQDSGIGIAPEYQHQIFSRFFRVDKSRSRRGGGTGIGLTIVKFLVEAHGGTVTVASVPELGSTFTVALPMISGEALAIIPVPVLTV